MSLTVQFNEWITSNADIPMVGTHLKQCAVSNIWQFVVLGFIKPFITQQWNVSLNNKISDKYSQNIRE